uniref:hypothetical protein n=1 Tax=Cocconeiopsis kantsiensis TaxID=3082010 RepID=UPI0030036CED
MNFKKHDIVIDWISYNIKDLTLEETSPIAEYFFSIGFNCQKQQKEKDIKYWFEKYENDYKVLFSEKVYARDFWSGVIISFSGYNAYKFYELIENHEFDWSVFDREITTLGLLDLHCLNDIPCKDSNPFDFLKQSYDYILKKSKKRTVKLENNTILRICKRTSYNYFRIYLKSDFTQIEFELEMKKHKTKVFQDYLFENNIEQFEAEVVDYFYKSWIRLLPSSKYTEWILDYQRDKKRSESKQLVTSFLNNKIDKSQSKMKSFYLLTQLLSYIRTLDVYEPVILSKQIYYHSSFKIADFLEYIGKDPTNYYQIKKVLKSLQDFQNIEPLTTYFDDKSFTKHVLFPSYSISKKDKYWIAELAFSEKLHQYNYPFAFSTSFLKIENNYDLLVKHQIVLSYSNRSSVKTLFVKTLIKGSSRTTKQQMQIRGIILQMLDCMEKNNLIESRYVVTKESGADIFTEKLENNMLAGANSLVFFERLYLEPL